jgi:hypothetical protein
MTEDHEIQPGRAAQTARYLAVDVTRGRGWLRAFWAVSSRRVRPVDSGTYQRPNPGRATIKSAWASNNAPLTSMRPDGTYALPPAQRIESPPSHRSRTIMEKAASSPHRRRHHG